MPQLEEQWFGALQQGPTANELVTFQRLAPSLPTAPLSASPGSGFAYNNFGYDLLACVIERVANGRFADVARDLIFSPAGMAGAGFDTRAEAEGGMYVASAVVPRLASGYNGASDRLQSAFPLMFGSAGAGGMYATARDLYNYDRAITKGVLFPLATQRDNLTRAIRINDSTAYGFGWFIRHPTRATHYLNHTGGNNGYNASYVRYPEDQVSIIVLSNFGSAETTDIRKAVARIILGKGRE